MGKHIERAMFTFFNGTCSHCDNDSFPYKYITPDLLAPDPFKIMLSKGGSLSGNYEIVADKNTFFNDLTLGNIFIKVKNPPGGTTVTK